MVKNTTIKVNLIFTFPKKKAEKERRIVMDKILINNFFSSPPSATSNKKKERIEVKSAQEKKNQRNVFLYRTHFRRWIECTFVLLEVPLAHSFSLWQKPAKASI